MIAGLLLMLAACSTNDVLQSETSAEKQNGTNAHFTIAIPDYSTVDTRVANFSNEGITSADDMKLLCFDKDGYFLGLAKELKIQTVASSDVNTDGGTEKKTISCNVADGTARLHIIANVNGDIDFAGKEAEWIGRHENNLIPSLEVTNHNDQAAKMTYWGYVKKENAEEMKTYLESDNVENNIIHLVRNRAKVLVYYEDNESGITNIRFAIGNVMKYGSIAPFNRESQTFPQTNLLTAETWKEQCKYITPSMNLAKTTQSEFSTGDDEMWPNSNNRPVNYTFEHQNTTADPLKVIMEVTFNDNTKKWYQVLLQQDGVQLPVKRNHVYRINIKKLGKNLGYDSAAGAYTGTPCNNPWITVDDIINEVSDGTYTLKIDDGTYQLFTTNDANKEKTVSFTYSGDDSMTADDFSATWTSNDGFAKSIAAPKLEYSNGKGTITYNIGAIGEKIKEGVIKLVDTKHGLSRNIHLYSKTYMDFGFAYSSTMSKEDGATQTLSFTIPSDFPKELLPIEVKIASDDINPEGCQVKVESTQETIGTDWNCWFIATYNDESVIGQKQTITLKNVRTNTTGTGEFWLYTKYTAGNTKDKEGYYKYSIKYQ